MKVPVKPTNFSHDVNQFALRHCCEDCAFFHPHVDRCAHFWPTADHRQTRYDCHDYDTVVFCKEFELE